MSASSVKRTSTAKTAVGLTLSKVLIPLLQKEICMLLYQFSNLAELLHNSSARRGNTCSFK